MALSLVTGPAIEPITLVEALAHLRIETSDEDEMVVSLIQTAREYIEQFTHRALISQIWDLKLDGFPSADWLNLPKPPLQITPTPPVITYVDTAGVTQTWGATLYTVDAPTGAWAREGRVVPAYGQVFPSTRDVPNAVTVRFVAGYGPTAATVPAMIKAAMKLLIGHWWSNREAATIGASANALPIGIDALLWPFKAW